MTANPKSTGKFFETRQNAAWTEEETEQARTWWVVDRLSSTVIGKRLGRTRNSIIGRMNRMGLSGVKPKSVYVTKKSKKSSARLIPPRGSAKVAARSAQVPSQVGRPPLAFNGGPGRTDGDGLKDTKVNACDPPIGDRKKLIHLKYHHCRWPLGTPTLFCSRTRIERSSYCEAHDRRSRKTG
jgi:hypothetical protein